MKLAIIGAGAVGSATAFAAVSKGLAREIVIQDINESLAQAQALDIEHGSSFYSTTSIIGTNDIEAVRDSSVVVVTAGPKQEKGQSRIDLATKAIDMMKVIIPPLVEVAPNAVFILVSNPVDIITYVSQKISNLSPFQMFGSGTWLDSSRLRSKLATFTGVNAKNIHAYIVGEHGDSEIALWSSATIGNINIKNWHAPCGYPELTRDIREKIHKDVVSAAYKVIEGKGSTSYAIAFAVCDIIESIANDERRIMPVSTLITDEIENVEDVCLSLPRLVAKEGIASCLDSSFDVDELQGLQNSAKILREILSKNGF